MNELTTQQVKAARELLRWDQGTLAKNSGISLPTIARLEAEPGPIGGYGRTVAAIKAAFDQAGIVFIGAGETSLSGGAGVRLRG